MKIKLHNKGTSLKLNQSKVYEALEYVAKKIGNLSPKQYSSLSGEHMLQLQKRSDPKLPLYNLHDVVSGNKMLDMGAQYFILRENKPQSLSIVFFNKMKGRDMYQVIVKKLDGKFQSTSTLGAVPTKAKHIQF